MFARLRVVLVEALLPALFGALATLGLAPHDLWPATLAALVGQIALWHGVGVRRAAWRGFVFGGAYFGVAVYWVFIAMHDNAGVASPLAVLATAALAGYLALYPALAGGIAGALRRLPALPWALAIVPAAWTLAEWLRSWLLTGFDWAALGYIATNIPVNGIAPVVGVHGWTFLIVAAAGTLYLLYAGRLAARIVSALLVLILPLLLWWLPPAVHWTRPAGQPFPVAVIQGNIAQSEKWNPANRAPTVARYARLTARSDVPLVVWPEVAIPATVAQVAPALADIAAAARRSDQTVLVGILRAGPKPGRYQNALLALGAGRGEYHKRHLVPFGEYVPGPKWLGRWLDTLGAPIGRIAPGRGRPGLIHTHDVAIGASICFEDIFGRDIRRELPAAEILVNVTNDGWFAGTNGPAQHLQIARMRAAEAGRPLVRAANTGISALIGFTGRINEATREGVTARLVGRVTPRVGTTPYVRYGETPIVALCIALLALAGCFAGLVAWRGRRRDRIADRRRELARRV